MGLGYLGWIYLVCHSFSYFNVGGEIAYNGDYNSLISALEAWPQNKPLPIILFRSFTSSLPPPPFKRGLIPRKRPKSRGGWCVMLAFIESDLTRDLLSQPNQLGQQRYMLWALEDQDNISGLLKELGMRGLRGHLGAIIEALIKSSHPRLRKALSMKEPFGKTEEYRQKIREASIEKLAHLIKACGILLQTKTYLFWQKQK
jgi:hypothetical protein